MKIPSVKKLGRTISIDSSSPLAHRYRFSKLSFAQSQIFKYLCIRRFLISLLCETVDIFWALRFKSGSECGRLLVAVRLKMVLSLASWGLARPQTGVWWGRIVRKELGWGEQQRGRRQQPITNRRTDPRAEVTKKSPLLDPKSLMQMMGIIYETTMKPISVRFSKCCKILLC
jgi:hypothetical protein